VNSREFQDRFIRRARRAGVSISPEVRAKLEIYYRLLATWNEKINLTGLNLTEPNSDALDGCSSSRSLPARHVSATVATSH
jgi:hypothetical protein